MEALPLDRSQKRRALPPFRSSHILDPIREGPDSVHATLAVRHPMEALNVRKQDAIPEKRDWNYSRRSHVRSSKALNLVAKLRMNASCCIIAITRAFKKYRLHSAHVTATPFLSLIPPFLLRSCILPLRFCDPRWLHLYKERKGEMKLSGCVEIKKIKAMSLSRSSRNEPKKNYQRAICPGFAC